MTLADPTLSHDAAPKDKATSSKSPDGLILLVVLVLLVLWGLSIFAFGVPGLYMPAVAAVPVIWVVLLMISRT
ncbi:hypothetical protein [Thalassovita taeanensis]|uniref:Uncharacterized protein n=1 Tax=Thalassovita taeanensis TaxID=657014 RepID=A0A1H9EUY7_9RHOB|nr:hypothetical protein [Thalassovita taeanensis]SEQ29566.1 hypothetical protein SAMN04488092_105183 [Thalassovita taeanensis]